MADKLQVGELVRIRPGAQITDASREAGIKVGSIVRVRSINEDSFTGFWALGRRVGYFYAGEYERNPKVRVGDRVRIKDTAEVHPRYHGKVVEVTALDEDGDPDLPDAFLLPGEYDLVPYNTPLTYPEEPAVPEAPPAPTAPQTDFRVKLKTVLIENYHTRGDEEFDDGWNEALQTVAAAMGMRLTLEPARVTCEDAT